MSTASTQQEPIMVTQTCSSRESMSTTTRLLVSLDSCRQKINLNCRCVTLFYPRVTQEIREGGIFLLKLM